MWTHRTEQTNKRNTLRITISRGDNPLRFDEVIEQWQKNAEFRSFYIDILTAAPFKALFWEMPPLTVSTLNHPYEFILADSPQLASVAPDETAFHEHFQWVTNNENVVAFENLGGDAMLISPCPIAPTDAYPHIAAFARAAPDGQKHAFFQRLGAEITSRMSDQPLWISTSGLGVYWLHARLDSVPKYYTYQPYRIHQ